MIEETGVVGAKILKISEYVDEITLASAECRLPESLHFTECDVILGVVRARSVHKIGYGHNRDWPAA